MYFSISWDDNCIENDKIGNLLTKYNIKATFYIDNPTKNVSLIKNISKDFQVGAHTITHPRLSQLSILKQEIEISESKKHLEDVISMPVELFAYPYGDYDEKTIRILRKSDFKFARTTSTLGYTFQKTSVYEMPVNLIVSPTKFERERRISNFIRVYRNRRHLRKMFSLSAPVVTNCFKTIRHIMVYYLDKIDFLHLWGHSWQIEKYNYWNEVEAIFSLIASNPLIKTVDNSELFEVFNFQNTDR